MQVYFLTHAIKDTRTGKSNFDFRPFFSMESALDALEKQSLDEESFRKTHAISERVDVRSYSSPMRKDLCAEMDIVHEIWKISEHEVRANPEERFYALLHTDDNFPGSASVSVYKTKKTARNHMREDSSQAEEDLARRFGERYEYAEWETDKDYTEVYIGRKVERWEIKMYKVPTI